VYEPWDGVPLVSTTIRTAEGVKYVSNLYNATKISFFNEMHRVLAPRGVDFGVVAEAVQLGAEGMWNPAYGTRAGAPYGGACLPKDSRSFLGYVEALGLSDLVPILRAQLEVNADVERETTRDMSFAGSGDEVTL
jgi:UDPglucose 6-dehydrogenase